MSTSSLRIYQPINHLLGAEEVVNIKQWVNDSLQTGAKTLLLDLKNVLFMDSRGLAVLVIADKWAKQMGGVLVLCAAQEQVLMVFRLSNLLNFFPLYESIEEYQQTIADL